MPARQPLLLKVGKRKTAVARVIVKPGEGTVRINRIPIEIYQPKLARMKLVELLQLSGDLWKKLDIDAKVRGGGFMGQAEAVRMAIARALVDWVKGSERERLRRTFEAYDRTVLVGDPRRTEPKKFGGPSSRTRVQKSYR